jgi:hypothetical protein
MPTSTYWKMWDGMRRGEWENRAVFYCFYFASRRINKRVK